MGSVYGSHIYMGLQQEGPFAGDPKTEIFRRVAYFVTLAGSEIQSLDDLEGKTVALGPPGSGTVFNCAPPTS